MGLAFDLGDHLEATAPVKALCPQVLSVHMPGCKLVWGLGFGV